MADELVRIHRKLAQNAVNIHLYYVVLNNFDNSIEDYDYTKNVIQPETEKITKKYTIENIKEDPIIAAYRKFYWAHLKIDPTKIRPSGEALVRRILKGRKIPKISYFVDAYNWGSCSSLIPIGSYDLDTFKTPITIRYAKKGEKYHTIGNKERIMKGNEVLTAGQDRILSQFPYRDADATKITNSTQNIIILSMGVEGVPKKAVYKGIEFTLQYLKKIISGIPSYSVSEPTYITNY